MTEKERKEHLKRRLHRYRDLEAERQQIAKELERVEDFMNGPRGANLDGMPRSPGIGNPVLGVVSHHLALQERYRLQLEKLAAAQAAIEDMIEGLEPLARQLMRYRYIDGLPWEEVCVAIRYSWRQTHNIHAKALDTLLAAEMEKEAAKGKPEPGPCDELPWAHDGCEKCRGCCGDYGDEE